MARRGDGQIRNEFVSSRGITCGSKRERKDSSLEGFTLMEPKSSRGIVRRRMIKRRLYDCWRARLSGYADDGRESDSRQE